MSAWYVYMLRCADGTLYTGITNNLLRRLERHNAGTGAKYTRSRLPVVVAWKKRMHSASAARQEEAAIKRMARMQKETLLQGTARKRKPM